MPNIQNDSDLSKVSVQLQIDLLPVGRPGSELERTSLLIERPVPEVQLAEGLEKCPTF